ncbi:Uncharacterized membrane protein YhaH, DUF805 family [Vibrio xiamenensis]|uniref:Uncharacterized membrane protein YhaH, DUF805 family n=1 Tax=Vibrio xiamenensis TaxID=861298 RepID=A0A1G8G9G7_9VIBR|nr:DUF805 domain-containing protein [Vibrio xiamenensis]SDH91048.1 Uncharacterized membrane protein YhaH, DUF805 family [Vibrio xiamenensis]
MKWFIQAFKKYAVFNGRARRKEFWMYYLFLIIFMVVAAVIDAAMGSFVLSAVFTLVTLVPTLSVYIRRLHDTGRSGWWILISLIPLVGGLVLFYFLISDGGVEDNQYGESPKMVAA